MRGRPWIIAGIAAILGGVALGAGAHLISRAVHDEKKPTAPSLARVRLGAPGPSIPLDNEYAPYSLNGSVITFPSSSRGHYFDQVEQVDIEDGGRRVVARTTFRDGFINWAVSVGPWVVYTDQSRQQSDGAPEVLWRVLARNTTTRERRVLASNGGDADPFVPRPYSAEGYAYWSAAEPDRSARESLWRPEWPAPRPLLERARFAPTSETISDGWLYYLADPARPQKDPLASDCWRIPVAGGRAEPVTANGFVMSCHPQGDRITWAEHIDPATEEPPEGDVSDNPYELWARYLDEPPLLLHRGYMPGAHPSLAGDYLVWEDWDGVWITSLQHPEVSTKIADDAPQELALVDGDRLVLLTTQDGMDYAQVYDVRHVKVVR